jgi:plasmid maintenance system antidote protein VapI
VGEVVSKKEKSYSRQKVAERLTHFRENVLKTSQVAFAGAIDIPWRTLQSYEQCRSDISVEFVVRLSEKLGLDPMWVLLGIGRDPEDPQNEGVDLHYMAVKSVEVALQAKNLTLSPDKHAELVQIVYRRVKEDLGDLSKVDVEALVRLVS